jgi:hypothetical protein
MEAGSDTVRQRITKHAIGDSDGASYMCGERRNVLCKNWASGSGSGETGRFREGVKGYQLYRIILMKVLFWEFYYTFQRNRSLCTAIDPDLVFRYQGQPVADQPATRGSSISSVFATGPCEVMTSPLLVEEQRIETLYIYATYPVNNTQYPLASRIPNLSQRSSNVISAISLDLAIHATTTTPRPRQSPPSSPKQIQS